MKDYHAFMDERIRQTGKNKFTKLMEILTGDANLKKLEEYNAKIDKSI
jgi:hypothetical protein